MVQKRLCSLVFLSQCPAYASGNGFCPTGFEGMDDDEMMASIADGVGAKTVPAGLVRRRRKKGKAPKQPVTASTSKGFGAGAVAK